jgi:phasin family protein
MPSDTNWMSANNPFTQAMGQAKTAAEEFTKNFTDMKIPGLPGSEALLAAHRRNMEALSAANRIALEGAQAVAKRHMEIMQQTMSELTDTMRTLAAPEAPQARAAQQTDLLKRAYERAVANTHELADLIQRSNGEAVGLLNKRVAEAMDEVRTLVDQAKIEQPKA